MYQNTERHGVADSSVGHRSGDASRMIAETNEYGPKYARTDLLQRERLSLSHLAWLLDIDASNLRRKSTDPEKGFLYQPVYTDPDGRAWFAPWQLGIIAAYSMGQIDLETARRMREVKIYAMLDPVADACKAAPRRRRSKKGAAA